MLKIAKENVLKTCIFKLEMIVYIWREAITIRYSILKQKKSDVC